MNKGLLKQIQKLPASQKEEFLDLLEEYEKAQLRTSCSDNFIPLSLIHI